MMRRWKGDWEVGRLGGSWNGVERMVVVGGEIV